MTRLVAFLAAAWLVLGPAPAVLADDPRCADWEQHGAPPGIDLRLACAANEIIDTYTGNGDEPATDLPLGQYAAAALLAGVGLAILAVLVTRFLGRRAARRLASQAPDDWWICPACRSVNAVDVATCYACHASPAGSPGAGSPAVIHRAD